MGSNGWFSHFSLKLSHYNTYTYPTEQCFETVRIKTTNVGLILQLEYETRTKKNRSNFNRQAICPYRRFTFIRCFQYFAFRNFYIFYTFLLPYPGSIDFLNFKLQFNCNICESEMCCDSAIMYFYVSLISPKNFQFLILKKKFYQSMFI